MEKSKKVLWYEGMTLDPHHFQQWDRYHNQNLNFRIRTLNTYSWGLTELSAENEALSNGIFKLTRCAGVLPDGLVFNMPEDYPLPASRNFNDLFQATQDHLGVYLALPTEKSGGKNAALNPGHDGTITRYTMEEISIADENSGSDHRSVGTAKPNFQLLFSNESLEDHVVIKIAEIVRTSESEFDLNDEFIPACLYISASESLVSYIRSTLEFLVARSNALRGNRRFTPDGQLDIDLKSYPVYGQLVAISRCIPLLNQGFTTGRIHPQEVYDLLITMAGQLSVYSPVTDITPSGFPVYDHTNLASIFSTITKQIRQLLGEMVVEKNYHKLPMQKKSENMYSAEIQPESLVSDAEFYLTCSGDVSPERITSDLIDKLRVASQDMINEVLSTATRALPVLPSSGTPRGIPAQEGIHYLHLEKKGPFWDAIKRQKSISIYIPSDFTTLDYELLAVKEGS